MTKPVLSVIVPTLNEEHYVGGLLEDLSNQTFKDFEVIVSDSSSDDNTLKIVKQFNSRLGLQIVVVERLSAGHGRNGGAKLAHADLLLFLDADCRISSNLIEALNAEQNHTQADFMTTKFRADGWHVIDRLTYFIDSYFFAQSFRHHKPLLTGCCILIKKSLHDKIGGFNGRLTVGEDIDYARRLGLQSVHGHFVKKLKVVTSHRRFANDGRLVMLARHFYWTTGWKIKSDKVNSVQFGHYKSK